MNNNLSMICSLLILCFPSLLLPVVSGKMTTTTLLRSSVTSSSNLRGGGVEDNNEQEEHDRQLRPILCGCLSCNNAAWDAIAGDYSCGARITWLQTTHNFSEREACSKVAGAEFPNDCGPCNPQTCDPIIVSRPTPSPLSRPTPSPLSRPTQLVLDDTNTNCGCPDDCTAAVWNRVVDGYSCGQRITWLQTESAGIMGGPFTAQDSCRKVATDEYPNECGPCDPTTCTDTQNPTRSPSLRPTASPTAAPTTIAPTQTPTVSPTKSPTQVPTQSPTRFPTPIPTLSPTPVEEVCGCPTTSCTDAVLNTFAGDYTCRARMDYLQTSRGFTEFEACATVAGVEFPSECGGCDPDRCEDFFTPDYNNNPSSSSSSSYDDEDARKHPICGGAVNTSSDKQRECQTNLWNPTDDATMFCFAYGGTDDPCHLNNNNDPNDGRDKDPSLCLEDTLYLWDEPDTQQRSYSWAGRTWLEYSQRFATELRAMKARGTKVTSPMLKAGGPGVLRQNLQEFFDACGPACFDLEDPAYIDIIAINAFCGDFNGPAGCRGGAAFIYNEALATSNVFGNLPVYITNWSRLQTSNPEDQLEAIEAIDAFFPSTNNNNNGTDNRIVQRVYWFGATDFGGGSSNNFLTTVLNDGTSLGEHWRSKCDSLA